MEKKQNFIGCTKTTLVFSSDIDRSCSEAFSLRCSPPPSGTHWLYTECTSSILTTFSTSLSEEIPRHSVDPAGSTHCQHQAISICTHRQHLTLDIYFYLYISLLLSQTRISNFMLVWSIFIYFKNEWQVHIKLVHDVLYFFMKWQVLLWSWLTMTRLMHIKHRVFNINLVTFFSCGIFYRRYGLS